MKTLEPIRQAQQIEDNIFNTVTDPTEKLKLLQDNINNVVAINDTKVYNVTVIDDNVWYNKRKRTDNKLIYYYPIQYAKITLK